MDSIVAKKQRRKSASKRYSNMADFSNIDTGDSENYNNDSQYHVYQLGQAYESDDLYISYSEFEDDVQQDNAEHNEFDDVKQSNIQIEYNEKITSRKKTLNKDGVENWSQKHYDDKEKSDTTFSLLDLPIFSHESVLIPKSISSRFALTVGMFTFMLGSFFFVGTTLAVKDRVDGAGKRAIVSIKTALQSLRVNDFATSEKNIDKAHQEFIFASAEMNKISSFATFISQFIPGASKLSSGNHIIEAGKYLTHTAKEFHTIIPVVINKDSSLLTQDGKRVSFLALYKLVADQVDIAYEDVAKAKGHIDKVHLDDVPKEYQDTFVEMKEMLPLVESSLKHGVESRSVVEELLGANGPRTYLFLFQNNHEMRATGGFIGSYGIVKINNGNIEKMLVDDVFNPDGQLIDRVVPPLPIQKISADWSLHDSNWFVDFPLSAKKAMDFYERTGGPTVDGVVAITPVMMQKFLMITGPITLPQYNIVLTSENFMEIMQDEVEDEENYKEVTKNSDKDVKNKKEIEAKKSTEEGTNSEKDKKQPKKILSDLMPIMIDKLLDKDSPKHLARLVSAVSSGMQERHIIMYMTDENAQEIIESNDWGGTVLQTDKDYLSVINTNINGFKTDGIIDEAITHTANIDDDGYIVDTVQIKRVHNGGKTGFPWWDAVNSDYMRVYVPQGSELLSVEGQTREINTQRLDYDALKYERDSDVEKEENNMHIDEETGTRIYTEYNKTVFANWVYVSPQESVTITYKYRLPFRTDFDNDKNGKFGSYAVLFQKQSGSENSSIKSDIVLDDNFSQIWSSNNDANLRMHNDLKTDRYHGAVFRVK